MEKIHTCCVTGHRDIPKGMEDYVKSGLRREVLEAVKDGYVHFISGFAAGVDLMFAQIVAELKNDHLITLEAAIPYRKRMNTRDADFRRLIKCCDIVKVHSEGYSPGCFMARNKYMVDWSNRVIAVYDGRERGGTAATLKYARLKGLDIRQLLV